MKVFISWSGTVSRHVAEAMRDWLPAVIQEVEPWLSAEDIAPGERWSQRLASELSASKLGILCLTAENVSTPWILFEAGALSKSVGESRVIPLLCDLDYSDLVAPLSQFQATKLSREGIQRLLQSVNALCERPLSDARLDAAFKVWWPRLAERAFDIPEAGIPTPTKPTTVEIVLDQPFEQFDSIREEALKQALKEFLGARYDIRLISKEHGSTRVTVELELADAVKILEAIQNGVLPLGSAVSINILAVKDQSRDRARSIGPFDVFLCHNSVDKPEVRKLAKRLSDRGLVVWIDEEQLRPGVPWQGVLEEQIASIRSAVVCIGGVGVGPWQEVEMRAFLSELVRRNAPVIPVILPSAPDRQPELPLFLRQVTWVDLRTKDPDPLDQLVYGITGVRA